MKQITFLLLLSFSVFSFSQNIQFNDPLLKQWILNNPTVSGMGNGNTFADLNSDNEISTFEASRINNVSVVSSNDPLLLLNDLSDLTKFPNLETLMFRTDLISVNLPLLSNLERLDVEFSNQVNSTLDISTLITLINLSVKFQNSPPASNVGVNLIAANLLQAKYIQLENLSATNIDFTNLPQLVNFSIIRSQYNNAIDINSSNLLELLTIYESQLNNFTLRNVDNPTQISINASSISNIDIVDLAYIDTTNSFDSQLSIQDSAIGSLNFDNTDLEYLQITNNAILSSPLITSFQSNIDSMSFWKVSSMNLQEISLLNVENLDINESNWVADDWSLLNNLSRLEIYLCSSFQILDLSGFDNLFKLILIGNSNLEMLNVKNSSSFHSDVDNSNSLFTIAGHLNLEFICVPDSYSVDYNNYFLNQTIVPVINSYCSFNPGGNFNEIQGSISMDIDNNGCDPTDPKFPNFNFTATDGTVTGTISSNQSGEYYAPVQDGQHTITPNPENPTYWNISPPNVVVDFPTQTSPFTQDFCVTANGTIEDLEVIVVPLEQARPGFDTDYKVVVKNKGNQTASGAVTLDFEEDYMTLLSTNPNAGNSPSNQLSWSFNSLQPFQMEEYEYTMTLNTPTVTVNPLNGGDILTFTGTVTGTGTDAMPADNVMVFDQTVVNSYDPNDKTCLEGETIDPADVGEYVHYMIRFENTGTASAINVVVKDEIDLSQFDITTLIPLGGSHNYYTRIREGNVVEFIHEDINLDFNDATNDGYVLFKIKTLNTLVAGDTFDNTAEIFFDYNAPIVTNTETVTVMSTASIRETTDSSITVYPNPASGFINLSAASSIESATIMDINGRMLSQANFTGSATEQRISIENLSSGIYFVTIQSEVGQKVDKLIVE